MRNSLEINVASFKFPQFKSLIWRRAIIIIYLNLAEFINGITK